MGDSGRSRDVTGMPGMASTGRVGDEERVLTPESDIVEAVGKMGLLGTMNSDSALRYLGVEYCLTTTLPGDLRISSIRMPCSSIVRSRCFWSRK